MKRFIQGQDRYQSTLLPECLDDFVSEDNPVRAVEAFIDALDLVELGFERARPKATGRPAYHPSILLKLYAYGYLNRIQSSRRLEREAGRNVEPIVAARAPGAGFQDDRRFSQGQRTGAQRGVPPVRGAVPGDRPVHIPSGGHRRQ